ncbi:MAG TPA: GAF domain-containing protein [Gaiellaceae bacterium]|nr:GAF domain-containing protein [Gaiellaceae bacterium]
MTMPRSLSTLGSDVNDMMREIVEQVLELPGADGASLTEVDGDHFHFLVSLGIDRLLEGTEHPLTEGLGAVSLQIDEPLVIRADPDDDVKDSMTAGAGAIILAPITYGGATRGVLSVRSPDRNAFTDVDVATFGVLARSAGLALRNAALVDNLRAVVDTQSELLELESDHEEVMRAIVSRAQRLARADGAALIRYEGDEVIWWLTSGTAEQHAGYRHHRTGSLIGLAGAQNEILYAADTEADERTSPEVNARLGTRSVIVSPLQRDGEPFGALVLMTRQPEAFDSLAVETAGMMAHFVSGVLRNADGMRALEESEAQFRSAFQTSLLGVALTDLDARLVHVNDQLAALLGYTPDEMIGMYGAAVLHLAEVPAVEALMTDLLAGHRTEWTREVRAQRKDGEELWVRLGMSVARDYAGAPVRFVTLVDDISEERGLEDQLRHAQKMEAVGRLAGGIAHDFNNLLTAISGYTQFLLDGLDDETLAGYAAEIDRAAARAASLTGQLLTFSRRQVTQPRLVQLNAVVSEMQPVLQRLIGEDIDFLTRLAPDLRTIHADPAQVEQVIINIAVNARDAMPRGGSFTISTANAGEGVCVELTDTGVGMSPEQRSRLFDPFFTTKETGTGLGLATVYGIVEQSGAAIDVESEPGLGTSIRITFPAVDAAMEASGPAAAVAATKPVAGTGTVLLVEDENVVRQLVAEILESNGYAVLQAADGASAIEVLRRHVGGLELLLTDVVMPGMSGRDVARAVTTMRPGTPVLYMSGYTDSAIDKHGVLEPGVHFVQKPFSAAELTTRIREIVPAA